MAAIGGRIARQRILAGKALSLPKPAGARARHLYIAAVIVLICGWLAAALLYLSTLGEEAIAPAPAAGAGARAYGVEPRNSKQYASDVENVGGQAALLADEAHTWLAGFWRPRVRAVLLAAAAASIAAGLFLAAWRASRAVPRER